MQTIFILSLGATALGGAVSMGALFHLATTARANAARTRDKAPLETTDEGAEERTELDAALDAKRRDLETLTRRANTAMRALDAAACRLDARVGRKSRLSGRSANAGFTPFEIVPFDRSNYQRRESATEDVEQRARFVRAGRNSEQSAGASS